MKAAIKAVPATGEQDAEGGPRSEPGYGEPEAPSDRRERPLPDRWSGREAVGHGTRTPDEVEQNGQETEGGAVKDDGGALAVSVPEGLGQHGGRKNGMTRLAERAGRELRAAGGTVGARGAAGRHEELTAQEAQIAHMSRDGLSNPEIGTRLFISARTVQYDLQKVFTKLAAAASGRRRSRCAVGR